METCAMFDYRIFKMEHWEHRQEMLIFELKEYLLLAKDKESKSNMIDFFLPTLFDFALRGI